MLTGQIYEVSVMLAGGTRDDAIQYMEERHIPEVVKHEAFSRAVLFISDIDEAHFSLTTHYYIDQPEAFARYLEKDREALSKDFQKNLGKFNPSITRRLLEQPREIGH